VAIVKLDRPVVGRKPAKVTTRSSSGDIKNTEVYIIGHPCGLPLKVARDPKSVVSKVYDVTFQARLDAFGGNSGSPVFNSSTHCVEGILVQGKVDFERVGNYFRAAVFPSQGEDGEICYDILQVINKLPTESTQVTSSGCLLS